MGKARFVGAIALGFWLVAGLARAQPSPADRALATELFKHGRELMGNEDYAEACPRFEESQRLDPGGGTLLNLAICHAALGKTATAWSEFNDAIAIAQRDGRADREQLAHEQLAALEPKLSRLVIEVPADVDMPDLVVLRDGSPVARLAWGTAMPVDPGEHRVEASAPERLAWSATVIVGTDADRQSIRVPLLELAPTPEPPPPEPLPVIVAPPPVAAPLPAPHADEGSGIDYRAMLISGLVTGGVGLVATGFGIGFGIDALQKTNESDAECVGGCTDLGAQRSTEAVSAADASTALLIIGGVATATGIVLVVWSAAAGDAAITATVSGARLKATW